VTEPLFAQPLGRTTVTELVELSVTELAQCTSRRNLSSARRAMRFGANWPIGPCALIDLIGVDVHVHASGALHAALGEERMAPPERLIEMQREGLLGRKTGRGFFTYES
jgi:3-hydroxybutyryl-CoA dehydrogenase